MSGFVFLVRLVLALPRRGHSPNRSEFSDDVLWQRQLDAAKNFFDNSDERLAVRETVALARLGLSSRKLE